MENPKPPEILRLILEGEGLGTPYMGAYATSAKDPEFGQTSRPIHPKLERKLCDLGIQQLFSHQAEAYDRATAGEDVVVVTGTNSGKSLCYMLPAYEALLSEPAARVLAIYPTKALAQDQLQRFEALRPWEDLRCGVYDGTRLSLSALP